MKYFFDTEFIEWAGGIDLVSIGIVSENGDTYYAENTTFDQRNADQWVIDNVLAKLEYWGNPLSSKGYGNISTKGARGSLCTEAFATEVQISNTILGWMDMVGPDRHPQFYAYYAAYDWVIFARLFGRLIDKPAHFPMWVRDLKQMMWERGLSKEWKQQICPDPEGEHNALVDAQWNKQLHEAIMADDIAENKTS
jgi:hypothetical protein